MLVARKTHAHTYTNAHTLPIYFMTSKVKPEEISFISQSLLLSKINKTTTNGLSHSDPHRAVVVKTKLRYF